MKIQRTIIDETLDGFRVEMLFAEALEPNPSQNVVSIVAQLKTEDRYPYLADIQLVTLRHARDAVDREIRRIESAKGPRS
jgi:hypothetical protein